MSRQHLRRPSALHGWQDADQHRQQRRHMTIDVLDIIGMTLVVILALALVWAGAAWGGLI